MDGKGREETGRREERRVVVEEGASRRCVGSANPLPGLGPSNQRPHIP